MDFPVQPPSLLAIFMLSSSKSHQMLTSIFFFPLQGGIVRLKWDAENPLIYTGCLDGVVRLWDSRSGSCEREWYGHNGEILDLAVAR